MALIGKKAKRGRGVALSSKETIDWWVKQNNTNTKPIVTKIKNTMRRDRSRVTKSVHSSSDKEGAPVVLYKIKDGGHTEPSYKQRYSRIYKIIVGNQNGDIEMAEEIWSFFKQQ